MFEMGIPTATFLSMNVQQQQTYKQINNNHQGKFELKNFEKPKQKTNIPSYKKYLYTLTYPDPKVKPEP